MSVLGTTVFQVPKLGQTGFQIDQVNEQKRKQAQQQLQKEVDATGAEKAYMDNAMGLTGRYKQIADAVLTLFRKRNDLDIFKKKALYIYIREITGTETPYLTKVINILKGEFYTTYNELNEKGLIDLKKY